MGIPGLLQTLQPITRKIEIKRYAGKKVAIDAYCWLHKGAFSCGAELCQGIPTDAYVKFCLKLIEMLMHNGVIPLLVFDGGPLPNKREKEEERRERRAEYISKAMTFLREGNRVAANNCFNKAVDVTPEMAYALIQRLRALNIEYIVAPYEADAQLAFLACNKLVDAVITEDSDLLVYGCPAIVFKMDKFGNGEEILFEDVINSRFSTFTNFTKDMMRHMCVLSGCDYLPSIDRMGIKTATSHVRRHQDGYKALRFIRLEGNLKIPQGYDLGFQRADLTFQHQRVWNPIIKQVVTLTPFPTQDDEEENQGVDMGNGVIDITVNDRSGGWGNSTIVVQTLPSDLSFLGNEIPPNEGEKIAIGEINPITKVPFSNNSNGRANPSAKQQGRFISQSTVGVNIGTLKKKTSPLAPFLPRKSNSNSVTNYFLPIDNKLKGGFKPPRSSITGIVSQEYKGVDSNKTEKGSTVLQNENSNSEWEGDIEDEVNSVVQTASAPCSLDTASLTHSPNDENEIESITNNNNNNDNNNNNNNNNSIISNLPSVLNEGDLKQKIQIYVPSTPSPHKVIVKSKFFGKDDNSQTPTNPIDYTLPFSSTLPKIHTHLDVLITKKQNLENDWSDDDEIVYDSEDDEYKPIKEVTPRKATTIMKNLATESTSKDKESLSMRDNAKNEEQEKTSSILIEDEEDPTAPNFRRRYFPSRIQPRTSSTSTLQTITYESSLINNNKRLSLGRETLNRETSTNENGDTNSIKRARTLEDLETFRFKGVRKTLSGRLVDTESGDYIKSPLRDPIQKDLNEIENDDVPEVEKMWEIEYREGLSKFKKEEEPKEIDSDEDWLVSPFKSTPLKKCNSSIDFLSMSSSSDSHSLPKSQTQDVHSFLEEHSFQSEKSVSRLLSRKKSQIASPTVHNYPQTPPLDTSFSSPPSSPLIQVNNNNQINNFRPSVSLRDQFLFKSRSKTCMPTTTTTTTTATPQNTAQKTQVHNTRTPSSPAWVSKKQNHFVNNEQQRSSNNNNNTKNSTREKFSKFESDDSETIVVSDGEEGDEEDNNSSVRNNGNLVRVL